MSDKRSTEFPADETWEAAEKFIEELEARYDDEHLCSAHQVFLASTIRLLDQGWTLESLKAEVARIADIHEDVVAGLDDASTGPDVFETMRKLGLIAGGEGC